MGGTRSASDLCTSCGLCCNGALFDFGPLDEGEVHQVRSAGLQVIEKEGRVAFAIPCPCLDGAICTVYSQRPLTCRRFHCGVLKSLEAEAITYEEAQDRIEQGVAAAANLSKFLPPGKTAADARKWRREAGRAAAAPTLNASPMVMMALGLLDVVLDQYFRGTDQRQVMPRE